MFKWKPQLKFNRTNVLRERYRLLNIDKRVNPDNE